MEKSYLLFKIAVVCLLLGLCRATLDGDVEANEILCGENQFLDFDWNCADCNCDEMGSVSPQCDELGICK